MKLSKPAAKKSPARLKKRRAPAAKTQPKSAAKKPARPDIWSLRLYVAGQTSKSLAAFANLKQLCEQHLTGRYQIEIIDLVKHPQRAQTDQIMAMPTLVRKLPEPIKRLIGDLSNQERVLFGLDLQGPPKEFNS